MSRRAYGLRAWLVQRVTALFIGLFGLFMVLNMLFNAPADYAAWRGLMGSPIFSALVVLFFVSLLLHAWVGIRDLFMDYIKPVWLRLTLLVLLGGFLMGCGIWVAQIMTVVFLK